MSSDGSLLPAEALDPGALEPPALVAAAADQAGPSAEPLPEATSGQPTADQPEKKRRAEIDELQANNEKLQRVNDELRAVNAEYQCKLAELTALKTAADLRRDVSEENMHQSARRRDEFLAMLSHELRNPLGAMITATALLGAPDEAQRARLIRVLDRQTKQMARLLDDLLEVARVTGNKIELRKTVLDLREVSVDAVESIRTHMDMRRVDFNVDIDDGPLWVNGDAARLQQIQANLLSNAAKYTPAHGHVRFIARREGNEAVIRVQDDGPGIAQAMLEKVFDMFVQAERTLDRAEGGLGVGLTLVRSLVGMHGGTVIAVSAGEGAGSEFVVRLPLVAAPARAQASRPRQAGCPIQVSKVAVIEDNTDSREMLCEVLTSAGFQCSSADNGLAGLDLIETMKPDVALIDVGLPGLNGLELAQRLREGGRHPRLRLIALTGYGQQEDRRQAAAAGYHAHFVKPIDPQHLVGFLKNGARDPDEVN